MVNLKLFQRELQNKALWSIKDWITFINTIYNEVSQDLKIQILRDRLNYEYRKPDSREIQIILDVIKSVYISNNVDILGLEIHSRVQPIINLNKVVSEIISKNIISDDEEEEEELLFSPVTKFDSLSPSHAIATVRNVNIEPTSANLAKSWSIWFKADNITKTSEKVFSISDASGEAIVLFLYNADSTTVPNKLEYLRYGNAAGTISISARTASKIFRNRWNHIAITDAGGTVNTSLNIYLNGVLETVTRFSAGVFVNSYSTGTNRLVLGHSLDTTPVTDRHFGGMLKHVTCLNRVLTQEEVTKVFNNGTPLEDISLSGLDADIVEHFPLESNLTGIKGMILTGTNITFSTSRVNIAAENLSFKKHLDNNTRYIAFGGMIRQGNIYLNYLRDGFNHLLEGLLLKSSQDMTDFKIDAVNTVVINEPTTSRVSGVSVGEINGKIVPFCSHTQDIGNVFVKEGRYESTDGLIGNTFGAHIDMNLEIYPRREFYGKVIQGFLNGEYIVPFFEHNNDVEWRISIIRTLDGINFTKHLVYEGLTKLGEPNIIKADNRIIMLSRNNSGGIWQITSANNDVTTWGVPSVTNVGVGICNVDMCLNDDGNIDMVFMDRNERGLWISLDNIPSIIVASPTSWNTAKRIARGYPTDSTGIIGYPNIINHGKNKRVITYCAEHSTTRCDLFWGEGDLIEIDS